MTTLDSGGSRQKACEECPAMAAARNLVALCGLSP